MDCYNWTRLKPIAKLGSIAKNLFMNGIRSGHSFTRLQLGNFIHEFIFSIISLPTRLHR